MNNGEHLLKTNCDPLLDDLDNQQISERIQRMCSTLSLMRNRLPNNGEKLRSTIRQLLDELDHRKRVKSRKESERGVMAMQSEAAESPAPPNLDRGDILSPRDSESPPPELEVVMSNGDPLLDDLDNQQISERIQRMSSTLSRMCGRLPDNGEKMRVTIRQLQDELDRRKRVKSRKESERGVRAIQSEAAESPDLPCVRNYSSPCTATESQHHSFGSLFSKKLEERADPAPNRGLFFKKIKERADPAPNMRPVAISRDKCENSRTNGRDPHENRKQTRLPSQLAGGSYRSSPFRCASRIDDKDSNYRVAKLSPAGKSFFGSLSKRKASESNYPLNSKSRKEVQEVVLLDEEAEPKQPVLRDTPDDWKEARIYYPSRNDPEAIELSHEDIKCLEPERFLTSPIMNFYIRYLQKPGSRVGRPRGEYHFFNTYFFSKLHEAVSCKGDKDAQFLKLRRWLKGVDIFRKAYIFLPIHGDLHWSLVIICIPAKEDELGPVVLHLDSLKIHSSDAILDTVCCYLKEEWNYMNKNGPPPDLPIAASIWSKLPSRIDKRQLKVPQQKNEYDCGLFVLFFMERFIDEAPERLKMEDLAKFGNKWFKSEEASGLRERVRDLLHEEYENARLELESPSSSSGSPEDDVHQLIEI